MEQNRSAEEFYLSNENPFEFFNNETSSKESKNHIESVFSVQPSFIPSAIDSSELKSALYTHYQDIESIRDKILIKFLKSKNLEPMPVEEFINTHYETDDEEILSILVKLEQIKLYNKQQQLRDRIMGGIREVMSDEQLSRAFSKRLIDEDKDCAIVKILERNNREKNTADNLSQD